ncbi:hypothetical protein ACOSQ3_008108 [Xanthoceras sorbifolium]
MEVLVGPTAYSMEMEVSSTASVCVRDRAAGGGGCVVVPAAQDINKKVVSGSCLFLKEETGSDDLSDSSSSSSSSIGAPGDSDDEEEVNKDADVDVSSSSSKLFLDSLEDSLPIKRGLSSHFGGKSKSFGNLSDVSTVKDLEKPENPFNKRRRVLISNKWSRKSSSFYSSHNPKSMPLLTVHEHRDHHDRELEREEDDDDEEHDEDDNEVEEEEKSQTRVCGNRLKKKIGFKSQSCFSLADLHEQEYL